VKTQVGIDIAFTLTFGRERVTLSRDELLKLRARIDLFLRDSMDPHILAIQEVVSEEFEISPLEMLSAAKTDRAAFPRMIAMLLCTEFLPDQSNNAIGKAFYRDHGTVRHGIQSVHDRCDTEPHMKLRVNSLRKRVRDRLSTLNDQLSTRSTGDPT
jgi:hypothetical protein